MVSVLFAIGVITGTLNAGESLRARELLWGALWAIYAVVCLLGLTT